MLGLGTSGNSRARSGYDLQLREVQGNIIEVNGMRMFRTHTRQWTRMGEQRHTELLRNLQDSISLCAIRKVTGIRVPLQPPQTVILDACAKKVGCLWSPRIDACERYYSFRVPLLEGDKTAYNPCARVRRSLKCRNKDRF